MHGRILMLIGALATAPIAGAQEEVVLRGRLVNGHGEPIALAEVRVNRARLSTNDSGRFAARLEPGRVNLEAKRLGYMPSKMALRITRDTAIEIIMLPSPGQLKAVTVSAQAITGLDRLGFFERAEQAKRGLLNGTFVTPEDITKRNPSAISQMLGNVQGISLKNSAGRQIPVGPDGSCIMTIFLDGTQVNNTKGQQSARGAMMEMEAKAAAGQDGLSFDYGGIDLVSSAHNLAAIEIYPRVTSAPMKYQPLANSCGVILVWTRDGASREARRQ